MNDEQLIDCVKKYNVLYDSSHARYMDLNFKNNVWKDIGEEMKSKAQLCKVRWSNIRDTFRKYLKKKVIKSGLRGKITKRYKYADQLSFLKKHLNERERKTKIKETDEIQQEFEERVPTDEESDSGDESEQDVAAAIQGTKVDRKETIQQTNSRREDGSASIQRTEKLRMQKQSTASKKGISKIKVTYSQLTSAAKLMDYIPAKNETQITTRTQPDAVDAFLIGITPTLKSLSALNFYFAKSEIFSIVQKYELKALEEQNLQELNCNYASANDTLSVGVPKVSPASSSKYSSTNNTPIGSPS